MESVKVPKLWRHIVKCHDLWMAVRHRHSQKENFRLYILETKVNKNKNLFHFFIGEEKKSERKNYGFLLILILHKLRKIKELYYIIFLIPWLFCVTFIFSTLDNNFNPTHQRHGRCNDIEDFREGQEQISKAKTKMLTHCHRDNND